METLRSVIFDRNTPHQYASDLLAAAPSPSSATEQVGQRIVPSAPSQEGPAVGPAREAETPLTDAEKLRFTLNIGGIPTTLDGEWCDAKFTGQLERALALAMETLEKAKNYIEEQRIVVAGHDNPGAEMRSAFMYNDISARIAEINRVRDGK